jgi:hypothetical protein
LQPLPQIDEGFFAKKYIAFISYSHKDRRTALWAQRTLERYLVPFKLARNRPVTKDVSRLLRPVFLDENELTTANDLGKELKGKIDSSHSFIIVCSSDAAMSKWVESEIDHLLNLSPLPMIILLVSAPQSNNDYSEIVPRILQDFYNNTNSTPLLLPLSRKRRELRRSGEKLIASILQVPFSTIHDRERMRWRQNASDIVAGALALAVVPAGFIRWQYSEVSLMTKIGTQMEVAMERDWESNTANMVCDAVSALEKERLTLTDFQTKRLRDIERVCKYGIQEYTCENFFALAGKELKASKSVDALAVLQRCKDEGPLEFEYTYQDLEDKINE